MLSYNQKPSVLTRIVFYAFLLVIVFPFVWMLLTSLKSSAEIIDYPPTFLPNKISIESYKELFQETDVFKYLFNSIVTALFTVLVTITFAFTTAYGLSRYANTLTKVSAFLSLFAYMVAPIMVVIPLIEIFKIFGLLDTRISLILVHSVICYPFSVWVLKAYLDSLPIQLEKSASIDGANNWQTLYHIIIPNTAPGLIAATIFTFILSWNDYILALLFTGKNLQTLPVALVNFTSQPYINWGMIMATGVLLSLPIVLLLILFGKRITKNLSISLTK